MYGHECTRKHRTIEEIITQRDGNEVIQQAKKDETQSSIEVIQNETADTTNVNTDSSNDSTVDKLAFSSLTLNDAVASTSHNTLVLPDNATNSNKSYASAAQNGFVENDTNRASLPLCTFYQNNGFCVYQNCQSIHGELCDLCGFWSIHPHNKQQSDLHRSVIFLF